MLQEGLGKDAMPALFPVIPGWDVAGVIEQVGPGVWEFAPGGEVIGYVRSDVLHAGSYAEFVAADDRVVGQPCVPADDRCRTARLDHADLESLVGLVEDGRLGVRVAGTYSLEQAADAQRALRSGHSPGKIVLVP